MIRRFYNKYTDDQKVSFWVVVSNIFLVVFSFGLGLLIQDSMINKTQEMNKVLAQYEYGSKIFPAVRTIYGNSASEILLELNKWNNIENEDSTLHTLKEIYTNHTAAYYNTVDTLVKVMGELKYYCPEYYNTISKNNSTLIFSSTLLRFFATLKQRDGNPDSIGNNCIDKLISNPDLLIYGGGIQDIEEYGQLSGKLDSLRQEFQEVKALEDSSKIHIPELVEAVKEFNDSRFSDIEDLLIPAMNKALLKNLLILEELKTKNAEFGKGKGIESFFTIEWLAFAVAIFLAIGISIVFTIHIFPQRINRNHTSQEYEKLKKKLARYEQQQDKK